MKQCKKNIIYLFARLQVIKLINLHVKVPGMNNCAWNLSANMTLTVQLSLLCAAGTPAL